MCSGCAATCLRPALCTPLSKSTFHRHVRGDDAAVPGGTGEADPAVLSILSKNCISQPSEARLWDGVDRLIQIKN